MASDAQTYPFGIQDVVELLQLKVRRRIAGSMYVDCPFCGDRRGRMNVHFSKNVWRCNHCDAHGGVLALYARFYSINYGEAFREICEALNVPNCQGGYEAVRPPMQETAPGTAAPAPRKRPPELPQAERATRYRKACSAKLDGSSPANERCTSPAGTGELNREREPKRATIALARKLLTLIYTMLKTGIPYSEECFDIRRKQSERKRAVRVVNGLQKLGYSVVAPGQRHYSPAAALQEIELQGLEIPSVSVTTLYRYIYRCYFKFRAIDLPVGRYHCRKQQEQYISQKHSHDKSISQRPAAAESREQAGHWEMDTVIGTKTKGPCLLVLTERKTRFEIVKLMNSKSVHETIRCLQEVKSEYGPAFQEVFKSIT